MTKVLLSDFGHYQLSTKAMKLIAQKLGKECYFFDWDIQQIVPEGAVMKGYWYAVDSEERPEFPDETDPHIIKIENRADPLLIEVVETLGREAFETDYKHIRIAEIPDGVDWVIQMNDETSYEWIAEKHATWFGDRI